MNEEITQATPEEEYNPWSKEVREKASEGLDIVDPEILTAWFDVIPDDVYQKCHCSPECQVKWRYVSKDEKLLKEHFDRFVANYKKGE